MVEAEAADKVNARNAGQLVLDCFWKLAEADAAAREEATATLLTELAASDNRPALQEYVLNRLVKGAGSGRDAARQGFVAALACLLEGPFEVPVDTILSKTEEHLGCTGGMKPSEQKNNMLGQLFVYAALAQTGQMSDMESAAKLITHLLQLSSKRPFMAEACCNVALDVLDRLEPKAAAATIEATPALEDLLMAPAEAASAEALLLALHLWPVLPAALRKRCQLLPKGAAPPSRALFRAAGGAEPTARSSADDAAAAAFFAPAHLACVVEAVKGSSSAAPRLHSVWQHVLRLLLPGFTMRLPGSVKGEAHATTAAPAPGQLAALWTALVQQGLMDSSHERKAVGLQLFGVLLPHMAAADVPAVFSGTFMRTVANSLRDRGSYLHKGAAKCIDRLVAWAEQAPAAHGDARAAVLFALSSYAKAGFDGVAKSKAVSQLAATLDAGALEAYADQLVRAFVTGTLVLEGHGAPTERANGHTEASTSGSDGTAELAATRLWVLGQLGMLLKMKACAVPLAKRTLRLLAAVAFVQPGREAKACGEEAVRVLAGVGDIAADVRAFAATRATVLATEALPCMAEEAAAAPRNGVDGGSEHGAAASSRKGACLLSEVEAMLDAVAVCPSAQAALVYADRIEARTLESLAAMRAACGGSAAAGAAMQRLLAILRLMLHSDAFRVATGIVADLVPIVNEAFDAEVAAAAPGGERGAASSSEASDSEMDEGGSDADAAQPGWINRLTECLLALLADAGGGVPVSAVRAAAEGVWRAHSQHVNALVLTDLLQVVLRIDRKVASSDLFEQDEGGSDNEAASESGSSDHDSEDEGPGVSHADGEPAEDAASGSSGDEGAGSGDEGSDLDDEAMFRLDGHLAQYFTSLRASKQDGKAQTEALRQFQMRVLSLLEIWLKKQPRSVLAPLCALPMLRALRAACRPSGHAPLAKRLTAVLTHQLASCRPALPDDLAVPLLEASVSSEAAAADGALAATLNKALYFATRKSSSEVNAAATKVYGMLLRAVGDAAGRGSAAAAQLLRAQCAACVEETLQKRKTCWSHVALAGLVKSVPAAAGHVLQGALRHVGSRARTEFVRIEALQTSAACLRSSGADREALRALELDGEVAEAVSSVASGGFSSGLRWAEALSAAAGMLQGLHDVHGKRALRDVVPSKHAQLQAAVKHGLSADELPAKCATQLNRIRVLLEASGAQADKHSKSAPPAVGVHAGKAPRGGTRQGPENGKVADGTVRVSVKAAGGKRGAEKAAPSARTAMEAPQAKRKAPAGDKKKVKRSKGAVGS